VALGAGILASRLSGREVSQVLVDVSPYSFGPSHLGELNGVFYTHCYHPIIRRNTPLPVTRTDRYTTASPFQTTVQLEIFQGDDPDALKNVFVGNFRITGLTPMEDPNEVLCRMTLDLDGILGVTAIEKRTGKSKSITITNALKTMTDEDLETARRRMEELFATRGGELPPAAAHLEEEEEKADPAPGGDWERVQREARDLVERCRRLFSEMHDEDKEEAIGLNEEIEGAVASRDADVLADRVQELKELLFFVEGR
jgi:molecular chaperone DnaK (HSP70)